jgi:hypothetical protein
MLPKKYKYPPSSFSKDKKGINITRNNDFSKGQLHENVHIDQKVCPF